MELGIFGKGLLRTSQSTNAAGPWSEGYKGKDYYMLFVLPMRQVHGPRAIRKKIIIC